MTTKFSKAKFAGQKHQGRKKEQTILKPGRGSPVVNFADWRKVKLVRSSAAPSSTRSIKNSTSWAPLQTYTIRILKEEAYQSLSKQVLQVIVMHVKVGESSV